MSLSTEFQRAAELHANLNYRDVQQIFKSQRS